MEDETSKEKNNITFFASQIHLLVFWFNLIGASFFDYPPSYSFLSEL